jgi:copper chaperone CopZ
MVETVYCVHCGAICKHPVTETIDGQTLTFCCHGCVQVYELMREEGLTAGPARSTPLPVNPAAQPRSGGGPFQTITLPIAGMSCANCVAHVERDLRSVAGVVTVSVSLAAEQATVEMNPSQVTLADLKRAVEKAGYEVPNT